MASRGNEEVPIEPRERVGLVVQLTDQDSLHAALALPGAPLKRGATPHASEAAYRAWLIQGALNVRADAQVPPNSDTSLAFHKLTFEERHAIECEQWKAKQWEWHLAENRRGLNPIGKFAILLEVSPVDEDVAIHESARDFG